MERINICSGFSGNEPRVLVYFFSEAHFRGCLMRDDQITLAFKGLRVVGGIITRHDKIVCKVGTPYVRRKLCDAVKKD